ncbi:MAG: sugar phosphate isomerase/epimerase [Spirochaetaceae bacterium]|nr:MAG: sugar phosphate isomerase/epimerase [Spirochaetaceae bacterium]
MQDLSRLCIHTATTKPWSIEIAVEQYARANVAGITVWRDALTGRNPATVGRAIRDAGLEVVSLCRGGFFPSVDADARARAQADNLRAVEEAEALGAPLIVLVCGADPAQSLDDSRAQIIEGIRAVAGRAQDAGVRLAIEPLHPMYADAKSAVNTMQSANDMCDAIQLPNVGVAVDVYHIWWDPGAFDQIARCGTAGRLFAFHVCDWRVPTRDLLLDRGLMGEGCIDIPRFRSAVEKAGFSGFNEVEIFSTDYWSGDQSAYLQRIIEAYRQHV